MIKRSKSSMKTEWFGGVTERGINAPASGLIGNGIPSVAKHVVLVFKLTPQISLGQCTGSAGTNLWMVSSPRRCLHPRQTVLPVHPTRFPVGWSPSQEPCWLSRVLAAVVRWFAVELHPLRGRLRRRLRIRNPCREVGTVGISKNHWLAVPFESRHVSYLSSMSIVLF